MLTLSIFRKSYLLVLAVAIPISLMPPVVQAEEKPELNLSEYLRKRGRFLKVPQQARNRDLEQLSLPRFKRLRELLLVDTKITDDGLKSIVHLPLDKLYLTGTEVGDPALDTLSKITSLTQLSLNGTKVTDSGLSKITHLPIMRIYLNDTAVSDDAVQHLKRFQLETLYMANTNLTDTGMAELQKLPIRALNISGTQVSDKSISILQGLPLYKVYLKGSRVSRQEAEKLKLAQVLVDY